MINSIKIRQVEEICKKVFMRHKIRKILVKHSDNKFANDEIEKEIEELIKEEVNNHWYKIKKEEFYELIIDNEYRVHFLIDNGTPIVILCCLSSDNEVDVEFILR